jgi:UDP-3-O-[3-hydroxymyristoyl] glucosamine N-acyltransferase
MIHPTAKIHPSAIIDGDVEIGAGTYVAAGAIISAVGGKITIGDRAVIMENAIIRSSKHFNCVIGDHTLIGPKASVTVLAVNGIIHIGTHCPANTFIPINHIGFGNPVKIYAPTEIQEFHADLKKVGFAKYVYDIDTTGLSNTEVYTQLTDKYLSFLG